jgi:hypothetical protein
MLIFRKKLINKYNYFKLDAFKSRVDSMESAGRESLLDSDIIHLSIHDAVLHAQKMFRKVRVYLIDLHNLI